MTYSPEYIAEQAKLADVSEEVAKTWLPAAEGAGMSLKEYMAADAELSGERSDQPVVVESESHPSE